MTRHHGLLGGTLSLVASRLGVILVSLGATAALARLVAPSEFGVMAAAIVLISMAVSIIENAFSVPIVQALEINNRKISAALYASGLAAICIWATIAFSAAAIAGAFRMPMLLDVLLWSGAAIPLKAISTVGQAMMQRQNRFQALGTIQFLSQVIGQILVAVPLAYYGFGTTALVMGVLAAYFTEAVYSSLTARLPLVLPTKLAKEDLSFLALGRSTTAAGIINWVALSVPTFLAARVIGVSGLGVFNRSQRLFDALVQLTSVPLARVALTRFSRLQLNTVEREEALQEAMTLGLPVFSAIAVCGFLASDIAVRLVLGPDWMAAAPVLAALCIGLFPRSAYKLPEMLTISVGRGREIVARQLLYAVLVGAFCSMGVGSGLEGLAWSFSCAVWAFYVITLIATVCRLKLSVRPLVIIHLRSAIPALVILFAAPAVGRIAGSNSGLIGDFLVPSAAVAAFFLLWMLFPKACFGIRVRACRAALIDPLVGERRA